MLNIRKATTSDAPLIALLGRISFNETFGHLFLDNNDLLAYHEKTFSVSKIASSLQKSTNIFWLAFYNELPVGYTKLKLNSVSEFLPSQQVCQLQKIYVLKDFLSKKIGLKLQASLIEEAQKRNYKTLWLSVYDDNVKAINFYKKNQFKNIGKHKFQIGKESFNFIAMAKQLM